MCAPVRARSEPPNPSAAVSAALVPKIPLLVARRAHHHRSVRRQHVEKLGQHRPPARVVVEPVGRAVPLAPGADEPGLHDGDHVRIRGQSRAKLLEMREDSRARRVRGTDRAEIVGEAQDHLHARSPARRGKIVSDPLDQSLRDRPGAIGPQHIVHVDQAHPLGPCIPQPVEARADRSSPGPGRSRRRCRSPARDWRSRPCSPCR